MMLTLIFDLELSYSVAYYVSHDHTETRVIMTAIFVESFVGKHIVEILLLLLLRMNVIATL